MIYLEVSMGVVGYTRRINHVLSKMNQEVNEHRSGQPMLREEELVCEKACCHGG